MKTYNVSPYFDDFTESNNYHQIMFKPGYAVQARELTQLQTILRSQIEKFGNHVFQHGSVVIPGNSYADLATPYIKVESTYNNEALNLNNFEGKVIVSATTGVKAVVKKAVAASAADPVTFYLAYTSGGSTTVGSTTTSYINFVDGEEVYVENSTAVRATLKTTSATGIGSLAVVNTGVYYINGTFVYVSGQSVVMDKYSSTPSCHVLFKITETFVDSIEDTNLLDPAQGSYNYAAPGADRLRINLELVTLPLGSAITNDYVELMRYNNGEVEEHARNPKYSELEKSLARRTFDESGNYVVNGLEPVVREHLKQNSNNGVYADGDISKLVVDVSPGKAYINGFEVEKVGRSRIVIDKARTADHIKDTSIVMRPQYGQYILITGITGGFSIYDHETVDIYNDNDPTNASATKIGTFKVIGIDYLIGDPDTNAIYKLWVTDVSLTGTYTIEQAGGIRYGSGNYATVVTQYKAPVSSGEFVEDDIITHASSGRTATVHYWDFASGTLYAYKHDHTKLLPRRGDLIVSDAATPTQSTILEQNTIISVGQSSLVFALPKAIPSTLKNPETNNYDLVYTVQKELTIVTNSSGAGSVSITSGSIDPIEVGTFIAVSSTGVLSNSLFALDTPGTTLTITGGPTSATIKVYAAVTKDSVTPKTKTLVSNTETFTYWTESTAVTLGQKIWYGDNLYTVSVLGTTGTTAPTHTSGSLSNGTATLAYVSSVSEITLEKNDIVSLTSIIDTVGDITPNFNLFNGQTDYLYDLGRISLKSGRSLPSGNFSVSYTYYQHSINGDFFCIDSYSSIANFLDRQVFYTSDSNGVIYDLAACLDFRPSVASDGTLSTTGSRRNDLIISGTTFNSSLQFYVPRIDTLTVDAFKNVSMVRGIPSENPVSPTVSTNQYELNRFFISAYTRTSAEVINTRLNVERFTMSDIQTIVNRIENLENFATLTASELAVTNYEITDAETGLSRYKTGYLVESFNDPFTIARTTSQDYAATFVGNSVTAPVETLICNMNIIDSSSNYIIKNGYAMLPYTETSFASQPLSSRVTNINPFLVVKWDGVLSVNPPADDWVEVRTLPTVFESKTEEVEVQNYVPCPVVVSSGGGGGGGGYQEDNTPMVNLNTYRITTTSKTGETVSYTTVGSTSSYAYITGANAAVGSTASKVGITVEVVGSTSVPKTSGSAPDIKSYAASIGASATKDAYAAVGYKYYDAGTTANIMAYKSGYAS